MDGEAEVREAEEGRAARFAGERSGCTREDFEVREGESPTVDCEADADVDEEWSPRGGRAGDLREKIPLPAPPPTVDDAVSACVAALGAGAEETGLPE